jgi:D-arabinose 1-dehydrogenase-like Zn-dependent alcohol dehydrogenase
MPSLVSGRKVYNDMLQFAARHGIRLVIEEFSLTEESFTKAIERMESGKLRYQAVLKNN